MSDLLAVEAVLALNGWGSHPSSGGGGGGLGGIEEWDALYDDLPSRQRKLPVQDRSAIVCSEDETTCLQPAALQAR
jgi:phosphoacetylglucosamine mutase